MAKKKSNLKTKKPIIKTSVKKKAVKKASKKNLNSKNKTNSKTVKKSTKVKQTNKVLKNVLECRTINPPFGVHVVISKVDTQDNLEKCEKIAEKVKENIENILFNTNNSFTNVSLFYTSSKQNFNTELPFLESLEKIYREKNPIIPQNEEKDPLLIHVLNNNETQNKYSCNSC